MNERGASLSLSNAIVAHNFAWVTAPNGRFAEGGGIFTRKGSTLAIKSSVVDRNTVD